ncbi:MAG: metallophosphoesterase [Polyangiales bacterium]
MRLLAFALVFLLGCDRRPAEQQSPPPAAPVASAAHVVAIGDLHGDLDATRRAFRLAGAIDANDAWIGGPLIVVQTGDEIDRGDDDRKILDWTEHLREAARAAGGQVVLLSGNHEIMNVQLDMRYVTPGGFSAFADVPARPELPLADLAMLQRGRATAFAPPDDAPHRRHVVTHLARSRIAKPNRDL